MISIQSLINKLMNNLELIVEKIKVIEAKLALLPIMTPELLEEYYEALNEWKRLKQDITTN